MCVCVGGGDYATMVVLERGRGTFIPQFSILITPYGNGVEMDPPFSFLVFLFFATCMNDSFILLLM